MKSHKLPSWLSVPMVCGAFAALAWLERRRPLRREVEPELTHDLRNLPLARLVSESVYRFRLITS
jgi:hypothetical protein